MEIGDLFPNPDNLKVKGVEDAPPNGDISQASDYINFADRINSGFDSVESRTNEYSLDTPALQDWAIAGNTVPLDSNNLDYRSSKSYAESSKSFCDPNIVEPIDYQGNPVTGEKNASSLQEDMQGVHGSCTTLADAALHTHQPDSVGYIEDIENDFSSGLSYLNQIEVCRGLLSTIDVTSVSKRYPLAEHLHSMHLSDNLTFSRSTTALYWDGSQYASAAVDQPRFEDKSLLLEPSGSNLFSGANCDTWQIYSGNRYDYTLSEKNPDGSGINKYFTQETSNSITVNKLVSHNNGSGYYSGRPICISVFVRDIGKVNNSNISSGYVMLYIAGDTSPANWRGMMKIDIDFVNMSTSLDPSYNNNTVGVADPSIKKIGSWYRISVYCKSFEFVQLEPSSMIDKLYGATVSVELVDPSDTESKIAFWCPQFEMGESARTDTTSPFYGTLTLCGPTSPMPDNASRGDDLLEIPGSFIPSVCSEGLDKNVPYFSCRYKWANGGPLPIISSPSQLDYILCISKFYTNHTPMIANNRIAQKTPYTFSIHAINAWITENGGSFSQGVHALQMLDSLESVSYQPIKICAYGHIQDIILYTGE